MCVMSTEPHTTAVPDFIRKMVPRFVVFWARTSIVLLPDRMASAQLPYRTRIGPPTGIIPTIIGGVRVRQGGVYAGGFHVAQAVRFGLGLGGGVLVGDGWGPGLSWSTGEGGGDGGRCVGREQESGTRVRD